MVSQTKETEYRLPKSIPYSGLEMFENDTLWSGTYLYGSYMAVPRPLSLLSGVTLGMHVEEYVFSVQDVFPECSSTDPGYVEELMDHVNQCLIEARASMDSGQMSNHDMWCHFGTVVIRDVDEGIVCIISVDHISFGCHELIVKR